MELARAADLRHGLGPQRQAEDQELEHVAALHVARDELAGDVLGADLLEHAPGVLARHGEVARGLVQVGAEAEAAARAPHLAPVEPAVTVGVHDHQRRRNARRVHERQGQADVRPSERAGSGGSARYVNVVWPPGGISPGTVWYTARPGLSSPGLNSFFHSQSY